jgi:hypothetical protein
MTKYFLRTAMVMAVLGAGALFPQAVRAHCDTLDGPVVSDARLALDKGDPAAILKWVGPKDEPEIRKAFGDAVAVRKLSPEAKGLADRYFMETLVRVHRAGEGAPYTGLKPAGAVAPYIAGADRALAAGSVDALVAHVTDEVARGIRERFAHANATRPHAADSAAAGREYVETYVNFTHYLEALQQVTDGHGALGHGAATPQAEHGH